MTAETKITKKMIADLRANEDDAWRNYEAVRKSREDAENKFRQQEYGVEKGDLVSIVRHGGAKAFYFFSHFDSMGWMYGHARRINGEPSKAVTCLYRGATVEPRP